MARHETCIMEAFWFANLFGLTKSLQQCRQCAEYSPRMFTEVSCLLPQIWTSSPLTVCISAIKMIVYIAINHKLESREKIVGGGEKKKVLTQNHSIPL